MLARLRKAPPVSISGRRVVEATDLWAAPQPGTHLPRSNLLIYRLDGARMALRPSGTEPKLKVYAEVVRPVAGAGLAEARRAAAAEMGALCEGVATLLGA